MHIILGTFLDKTIRYFYKQKRYVAIKHLTQSGKSN